MHRQLTRLFQKIICNPHFWGWPPGYQVNFTMTLERSKVSTFFFSFFLFFSFEALEIFFLSIFGIPPGNPSTFYSTPWNFHLYSLTGRLRIISWKSPYAQPFLIIFFFILVFWHKKKKKKKKCYQLFVNLQGCQQNYNQ